jgi:hypothetical protein
MARVIKLSESALKRKVRKIINETKYDQETLLSIATLIARGTGCRVVQDVYPQIEMPSGLNLAVGGDEGFHLAVHDGRDDVEIIDATNASIPRIIATGKALIKKWENSFPA